MLFTRIALNPPSEKKKRKELDHHFSVRKRIRAVLEKKFRKLAIIRLQFRSSTITARSEARFTMILQAS